MILRRTSIVRSPVTRLGDEHLVVKTHPAVLLHENLSIIIGERFMRAEGKPGLAGIVQTGT